jgi:hypothetical protein
MYGMSERILPGSNPPRGGDFQSHAEVEMPFLQEGVPSGKEGRREEESLNLDRGGGHAQSPEPHNRRAFFRTARAGKNVGID